MPVLSGISDMTELTVLSGVTGGAPEETGYLEPDTLTNFLHF